VYIVTVIPITRGAFKEHLSFFSKTELPEGSIVDVPVRNKPTPALVIGVKEAREEKLSIRGSSFSLKKITPKTIRHIVPRTTVEALKETAMWHALGLGEVLAHFSPSAVIRTNFSIKDTASEQKEGPAADVLALQAEYEERMRMYRSLAREAFARNESVLIISPTIAEAETLYEKLHRGIEDQVLLVTSASTKKAILAAWKRAAEDPDPLLIIATHSFITIPRKNLQAIIIERESARSYVSRERPHLDTRIAAEHIASKNASRIIFADFPLRMDTRARLQSGELEELTRLQVSAQSSGRVQIVDARTPKDPDAQKQKKKFSVFTDAVRTAIESEIKRGGRVFLYASRRGLAPVTVCNDCGTPITDPSTGTPMTLHKTGEGNVFLSFYSGAILPSNTSCTHCGSWNLVSLGVGVERVVEEAEKLFPDTTVFSLTADSAPTHAKAKKIQKYFFNTPRALLVGTDRALPYINEPVELTAVISIDSLLSITAWRAHEYALNTLFYLRDRTQDVLFIQTRLPDNPVMGAIAHGNPTEFIRNELKERHTFGYPPFSLFIGLSWNGTEKAVEKATEKLQELLKTWDTVGPLPPRQIAKNKYMARMVIRCERDTWPDMSLVTLLKSLPREISITVDPDEIV